MPESEEPVSGQTNTNTAAPKNLGGRPLKFQDEAELKAKIDAYFANCDPHVIEVEDLEYPFKKNAKGINERDYDSEPVVVKRKRMSQPVPYTITGLALALDTNRETLLDYEVGNHDLQPHEEGYDPDIDRFSDTIKKAKLICQNYAELYLYNGKNTAGAIFNLKNNYGWIDAQQTDGTQELIVTTRKHTRNTDNGSH